MLLNIFLSLVLLKVLLNIVLSGVCKRVNFLFVSASSLVVLAVIFSKEETCA